MGTTKRVQNIFGRNATKNRDFFGRFPLGNWSYCAAMAHPEKKKWLANLTTSYNITFGVIRLVVVADPKQKK